MNFWVSLYIIIGLLFLYLILGRIAVRRTIISPTFVYVVTSTVFVIFWPGFLAYAVYKTLQKKRHV